MNEKQFGEVYPWHKKIIENLFKEGVQAPHVRNEYEAMLMTSEPWYERTAEDEVNEFLKDKRKKPFKGYWLSKEDLIAFAEHLLKK